MLPHAIKLFPLPGSFACREVSAELDLVRLWYDNIIAHINNTTKQQRTRIIIQSNATKFGLVRQVIKDGEEDRECNIISPITCTAIFHCAACAMVEMAALKPATSWYPWFFYSS